MENKMMNNLYSNFRNYLNYLRENPDKVTDEVKEKLSLLLAELSKSLGLSEHSGWGVKWTIEKRNNAGEMLPFETVTGNIILNAGATEMLKLICGLPDANAYSSANAKIVVGSDSTAERADQTGVIALGGQKASAAMDDGYPQVALGGRTATFKATFGEGTANFAWNEISLVNGLLSNAVALNRKQATMGVKNGGVWSVQLEISVVELA